MAVPKPTKKQPPEETVDDETEYLESVRERYQTIREEETALDSAERLARLRASAALWNDELDEE